MAAGTPHRRSWLREGRVFVLAMMDRRTPLAAKLLLVVALLYGVSPLDFLPDVLPVIGQADDIAVMVGVLLWLLHVTKDVRERLRASRD